MTRRRLAGSVRSVTVAARSVGQSHKRERALAGAASMTEQRLGRPKGGTCKNNCSEPTRRTVPIRLHWNVEVAASRKFELRRGLAKIRILQVPPKGLPHQALV